MALARNIALIVLTCYVSQQQCAAAAAYTFDFSKGSSYQAGIYNSAQYYNANNINPNQYALDLLGAINASGVPLIVEAPSQERQPRMWMGTTVPEVEDGLVGAMDQALANGNYRTYGFICTAAISYNPVANGGSGPLGQIYCITAVSNVKNQANGTSIIRGACDASGPPDLTQAGLATSRGAPGQC